MGNDLSSDDMKNEATCNLLRVRPVRRVRWTRPVTADVILDPVVKQVEVLVRRVDRMCNKLGLTASTIFSRGSFTEAELVVLLRRLDEVEKFGEELKHQIPPMNDALYAGSKKYNSWYVMLEALNIVTSMDHDLNELLEDCTKLRVALCTESGSLRTFRDCSASDEARPFLEAQARAWVQPSEISLAAWSEELAPKPPESVEDLVEHMFAEHVQNDNTTTYAMDEAFTAYNKAIKAALEGDGAWADVIDLEKKFAAVWAEMATSPDVEKLAMACEHAQETQRLHIAALAAGGKSTYTMLQTPAGWRLEMAMTKHALANVDPALARDILRLNEVVHAALQVEQYDQLAAKLTEDDLVVGDLPQLARVAARMKAAALRHVGKGFADRFVLADLKLGATLLPTLLSDAKVPAGDDEMDTVITKLFAVRGPFMQTVLTHMGCLLITAKQALTGHAMEAEGKNFIDGMLYAAASGNPVAKEEVAHFQTKFTDGIQERQTHVDEQLADTRARIQDAKSQLEEILRKIEPTL